MKWGTTSYRSASCISAPRPTTTASPTSGGTASSGPTTATDSGSEARSVFGRALTEAIAEEARTSERIAELEREIEDLKVARQEASDLAGSLRTYLDRK